MEAFGAGSGPLEAMSLTLRSARFIHDALSKVKNAPKIISELSDDVLSVLGILKKFKEGSIPNNDVVFRDMVKSLATELDTIQAYITPLIPKPEDGRLNTIAKGLITLEKQKRLQDFRIRLRDKITWLGVLLNISQLQQVASISASLGVEASSSAPTLARVLETVTEIKEGLKIHNTAQRNGTRSGVSVLETATDQFASLGISTQLDEAIGRLAQLVTAEGFILNRDKADKLIGDIQSLIQVAKEKLLSKAASRRGNVYTQPARSEEHEAVKRDFDIVSGILLSSHRLAVNKSGINQTPPLVTS